jgi:SAM-dependent methyltransferase
MTTPDPETQRAESAERWDKAATGWNKRADEIRQFGMPVSAWMVEHAGLQPGQRVLELAAGPGDTGFLAAELIRPGGTLVSSDASEEMLAIARSRAREQGIENVEFAHLELEWIDLPAATVDTILCRWGIMLIVDPAAAVKEMRRVLRPGGRATVAVWDEAVKNPWATIPGRAMITLGHTQPPDPTAPGMFALAPADRLKSLLEDGGFMDVQVESVAVSRPAPGPDAFIAETLDCSGIFAGEYKNLSEGDRHAVRAEIAKLLEPYADAGGLVLPGSSLVAVASA